MNKYTIDYQYATYSGTRTVWGDTSERAIALMWRDLLRGGGLSMAYQSARVVAVEYGDDDQEGE